MNDDNTQIRLRKVGEDKENQLPRGVIPMTFSGQVIFVKRVAGRMMPLPQEEQERLRSKHVIQ